MTDAYMLDLSFLNRNGYKPEFSADVNTNGTQVFFGTDLLLVENGLLIKE